VVGLSFIPWGFGSAKKGWSLHIPITRTSFLPPHTYPNSAERVIEELWKEDCCCPIFNEQDW